MHIDIIQTSLALNVYGFAGVATDGNYKGMAFKLMDKMWQAVKSAGLKNKGQNIWVYEDDHRVFAGVELIDTPPQDTGLELKEINLPKYAYYKHTGPYHLIGQAGKNMTAELKSRGFDVVLPYIEIYGHWTNDEAKLETELLMQLA